MSEKRAVRLQATGAGRAVIRQPTAEWPLNSARYYGVLQTSRGESGMKMTMEGDESSLGGGDWWQVRSCAASLPNSICSSEQLARLLVARWTQVSLFGSGG
jgi:hypothetical protein